jgi:hypothetical protein
VNTQTEHITYSEIISALKGPLPKGGTKAGLIQFLIKEIKTRKVDKHLTADIEKELRLAGATNTLITAIKNNSPQEPTVSPTPIPKATPTPPDYLTTIGLKAGSYYRLNVEFNLMCLEVTNAEEDEGAAVGQFRCYDKDNYVFRKYSDGDHQIWKIEYADDKKDSVTLTNKHSGKRLVAIGGTLDSGGNIIQDNPKNTPTEKWRIERIPKNPNNYYFLKNINSNLCLSIHHRSIMEYESADQSKCDKNDDSMAWKIELIK